ncbi:hypothetical protein T11_9141 [Trichinella zimbabwensis]|uniref:Uncharacterized protein n=1 Tax=Trichinella zimbabwensis TaxID=268475 RepID=A0A0V1GMI3_9BILA|nr:hypothetical protein T11_12910 [Trichinella zimbabwensis]KRZ00016.1 hypothetical protein T11_9141 [Trichinella zimbabwensis]
MVSLISVAMDSVSALEQVQSHSATAVQRVH